MFCCTCPHAEYITSVVIAVTGFRFLDDDMHAVSELLLRSNRCWCAQEMSIVSLAIFFSSEAAQRRILREHAWA